MVIEEKKPWPKGRNRSNGRIAKEKEKAYNFCLDRVKWTNEIAYCPEYRPTKDELMDPLLYLQKIAPDASKYGICKIISPWEVSVPAAHVLTKEIKDFKFEALVQNLQVDTKEAVYKEKDRKYTYGTFEHKANEEFLRRFPRAGGRPLSYTEKRFWLQMAHDTETVEYAVNVEGSAFSSNPNDELATSNCNLKNLKKLPESVFRHLNRTVPGITDPMLYIGMIYSIFAWHVEDQYLYSINYLHSGEPKTWYGVPSHEALQFEKVAMYHVFASENFSPTWEDGVFRRIAEKTTMFPPNILQQHSVPVYKALQMPGEFVVTFPRAYHGGFNNGFNCSEAVNFALKDWFPFGKDAGNRYARLRKQLFVPYEELLVKEAMLLTEYTRESASTITAFIQYMESLNSNLMSLRNLNVPFVYTPMSETLICSLCHRDCYLASVQCVCRIRCIFHEAAKLHCSKGCNITVYLDHEIRSVETKAYDLQREEIMSKHTGVCSCIEDGLHLGREVRKI
ncbi:hypothetical protein Patl1_23820 [Pistacia atlantica]|uniref:Uncharacterized protein n=1 Tax=Pistacia atlantica TaxID=434234 RepID=A0ACC0ZZ89_9ROSI|nr:hypothetical protein Patl1_23820 [Pistacia atlantica]